MTNFFHINIYSPRHGKQKLVLTMKKQPLLLSIHVIITKQIQCSIEHWSEYFTKSTHLIESAQVLVIKKKILCTGVRKYS